MTQNPNAAKAYKTFVSPDGLHTQKVGTPTREVQLRHAGWTEDQPAAKPAATKADTPAPKTTSSKNTEK